MSLQGYASGDLAIGDDADTLPFYVSPYVVGAAAAFVLLGAYFARSLPDRTCAIPALAGTGVLTLVNVAVCLVLQIAFARVISIAISTATASIIVLARSMVSRRISPTGSTNQDAIIGHYHRIWHGRTVPEAENAVETSRQHYEIAAANVQELSAQIAKIKMDAAPFNPSHEKRIALTAQLAVLEPRLAATNAILLGLKDVYGTVSEAFESALRSDVFAPNTSLADFLTMDLTSKGANTARNQSYLKKTYGVKTFNVILSAVREHLNQAPEAEEAPVVQVAGVTIIRRRAGSTPYA